MLLLACLSRRPYFAPFRARFFMRGVDITNCRAAAGGGVAVHHLDGATESRGASVLPSVDWRDVTFTSCAAARIMSTDSLPATQSLHYGGGAFLAMADAWTARLDSVTMRSCTAVHVGGGLAAFANMLITSSLFESNTAMGEWKNAGMEEHRVGSGGGFAWHAGHEGLYADPMGLHCRVGAAWGQANCLVGRFGAATLELNSSTFTSNLARVSGGGLAIFNGREGTAVNDVNFTDCGLINDDTAATLRYAVGGGVAIWGSEHVTSTLRRTTFKDCYTRMNRPALGAVTGGAALWAYAPPSAPSCPPRTTSCPSYPCPWSITCSSTTVHLQE